MNMRQMNMRQMNMSISRHERDAIRCVLRNVSMDGATSFVQCVSIVNSQMRRSKLFRACFLAQGVRMQGRIMVLAAVVAFAQALNNILGSDGAKADEFSNLAAIRPVNISAYAEDEGEL